MSSDHPIEPRPSDLNALLDAISKALSMPAEDVAKALEAGSAQIELVEDPDGRRAVRIHIGERRGVVTLGKPHD